MRTSSEQRNKEQVVASREKKEKRREEKQERQAMTTVLYLAGSLARIQWGTSGQGGGRHWYIRICKDK